VEAYYSDACINGLKLDRHLEEQTVELFAQNIILAGKAFLELPGETPIIPSLNRVVCAIPDVLEQLRDAVERDNQ
jgi:glucosyl-3-phosphoglycerate synthase